MAMMTAHHARVFEDGGIVARRALSGKRHYHQMLRVRGLQRP
jgi:hypothetical protein